MRVPQSFLEGFIFTLLMIPVGIYFILKWIIKGIIVVVVSISKHR